jgi:hypothetical protein
MALHPSSTSSQRQWDLPIIEHLHNNLLSSSDVSDVTQKAILLAVSEPESGAWLDALPSSKLGTLLEKTTLQIAVSLRLGISICQPHICTCGSLVDTLSHHGLSCTKNAGRISRHSCLNDILKRAFSSANIPCILEPTGVLRDDGKRPDGITIIPWKKGKSLVWDVTCTDTLAPSHLSESSISPKSAANLAAVLKKGNINPYPTITFLLRLLWRLWVLGTMMHFLCWMNWENFCLIPQVFLKRKHT